MSVLVFGGAATLGELAAAEHVAPPTMSRLVRALERDGLVARATSTADRRIIHLAATPKGAQLLKQAQRRRLRLVSALLDAMTAAELRAVSAAVPALQRVLSAGVPRATHRQETK
jgi:DNA-binding MarR family transcriptional regulator